MAKVLKLAKKGIHTTMPNPMVASLIVKNGKILSKGVHKKSGLAHAEQIAINKLLDKGYTKQDLKEATLYVNLEPCNHIGKTESCSQKIIDSGIKRVVIASLDSNPKMRGKSLELLEKQAIECICFIFEKKAIKINQAHFKRYEKKLPLIHLKIACNLDGLMDDGTDKRVFISHSKSRDDSQKIRAKSGAIITTANTVIIDNPKMLVHSPKITKNKYFSHPIRVILDKELKTLNYFEKYNIFNDLKTKVIIYHNQEYFDDSQNSMKAKNEIEFRYIPLKNQHLDLILVLQDLMNNFEINSIMFESGATLSKAVLQQKLADSVTLYLAQTQFNSANPNSVAQCLGENLEDYRLKKIKKIANNIKLVFKKSNTARA